ncbi:alpha/beta hydrolase [Inquilinus sp. Marseille-Q2685]|uniref:alpha/beta hydrolase n=1 Tax=Inquilinus sp. Marseille-Q2685 TaxID=2866581 RepID=UPI001CE4B0DC|nr:alpha/beta hydrolase [Inquilinus sp. Marseille-Q2685]
MPLDPQAQAVLDARRDAQAFDYDTVTAAEFRAAFAIPAPSGPPAGGLRVEDRAIDGPGGPLGLRLYRPDGAGPYPVTLFLHGGGFTIGSPDATDGICRALAAGAGSLVVSVDYRLAPEAPFPAGLRDAEAALDWVHGNAAKIGGDAGRIAVAGNSSGGNFAAVLAQRSRSEGPALCHQLLLFPALDAAAEAESWRLHGEGLILTAPMMRWFWRLYLPDPALASDPRVSPLRRPDLFGLPPATIFTAEYDLLRDEGEAYAVALQAAGVPVALRRWPGQLHDFLLMQGAVDAAEDGLREAAAALRRGFA